MTLLILLCIVVVTALVHEGGHALAAKMCGGKFHGFTVRWYGMGAKCEVPEGKMWQAAAGGLIATALLAFVCYALSPLSIYFQIAFMLNAPLYLLNLIPLRISDGGYLWRAGRDRARG